MKTAVVILIATLAAAFGETLLSLGMRNLGDISHNFRERWTELFLAVLKNGYVGLGVVFLAVFFFLYLAALSWADLSFVMPLTSLSYFFAAVLAKFVLKEEVSWKRWAGTAVILLGICLVATDTSTRTGHGGEAPGAGAQAPAEPPR